MNKIIVIKVSPAGGYVTIGFFGDKGDSKMQMTLSSKIFPERIEQGDEVIFCKKASVLQITRNTEP